MTAAAPSSTTTDKPADAPAGTPQPSGDADLNQLYDDKPSDAKPDDTPKPGEGGEPPGDKKTDDSAGGGRSDDAPVPGKGEEGKDEPKGEPDKGPKEEELTFRPDQGYEKFAYGENVPVDEPLEKAFIDFAATLNGGKGLNQKDAQSVIDFYQKEVFGALDRASQATRPGWQQDSKSDPRYGGAKYAQSQEDIEAFLTLADNQAVSDNYKERQGLRAWLEGTGWIDYPPLRAALALAGENLTREPSGPAGDRKPIPRNAPDVSTARGFGQVMYSEDEEED